MTPFAVQNWSSQISAAQREKSFRFRMISLLRNIADQAGRRREVDRATCRDELRDNRERHGIALPFG
jgi:hypothetical protein